jgi:catechol 2,3-dioxygenase-like lactoylglutathione lyase family enzyme
MTEQRVRNQIVHRWYSRPVLFVADVDRALRFYVDMLGFEKRWRGSFGALGQEGAHHRG